MLLTDKFIRVKNFRTLSLKQNLFTDGKKANYGSARPNINMHNYILYIYIYNYIIIYIYIYIYIYVCVCVCVCVNCGMRKGVTSW